MDVAAELRELAAEIEAITRDSRVCGIAWEQVRALVDHLHASSPGDRARGAGGRELANPAQGGGSKTIGVGVGSVPRTATKN